ncbi:MurR/RpiR family transcriptional regulator [Mangrovicoccus algicola]|uniref:MurR/RpiR family transcriptional regulator n=1 Tax=Mangrovicoccus algicola TaxID=2771008 RepID=A0A8J6ZAS3_9RHOB|nr:MurR/RpiR family transcriptional regulator [Mangrovicoccus algicola]MBE3639515.1 MurR/RpiR family transcriptional regulator [Mangrovicoccus algicola]
MDPTQKTRLLAALQDRMDSLSPQQRKAARHVIAHPLDVGMDPIRDTAQKAGVSTYTLVSLAKLMGFGGYRAFREPFRQALLPGAAAATAPAWLTQDAAGDDGGAVFAAAAANAMGIVARSLEGQDPATLDAMARRLMQADRVFLTAARASYAMAYYVHYVGRMALPALELIPRHHNSAIDDLNDARPGDVLLAIAVTPHSRETVEACLFAQNKGMDVLLVSDTAEVAPGLRPAHVLVASVQSTHRFGCFAGMMAVLETLLALLMHRGGSRAQERIESYDRLRNDSAAYWPQAKKQ